ncbi:MAG TPA: PA14 domain-containing protein, partial [Candidatus Binatus sp.]|nr:PA14 domain-containing protein [Candidatus Binatus sp.]
MPPTQQPSRVIALVIAPMLWLVYAGFCVANLGAQETLSLHNNKPEAERTLRVVTNAAEFRSVSAESFLDGCAFQLTGLLTLVDTNRHLVVLQDDTGAVALNFYNQGEKLEAGQLVTLSSTNCFPYFENFPDYPQRPSTRDVRDNFEAPENSGDYHLNRLRGFLHPPATGEYTFWIASDNSSELWLSADEDPSRVRRIAFLGQRNWVDPHE